MPLNTDGARFNLSDASSITMDGRVTLDALTFETDGWSINGGGYTLYVDSVANNALGTNTIDAKMAISDGSVISAVAGSVLTVSERIDTRGYDLVFSGGGRVELALALGGSNAAGGDWGAHIQDASVLVDSAEAFAGWSNGKVFIEDFDAVLELKSNMDAVELLIANGEIVDSYGGGLVITDLMNGYVEVRPYQPVGTVWTGEGGDTLFGTAANWSGLYVPTSSDVITFDDNSNGSVVNFTERTTVQGIDFQTSGWTLNGNGNTLYTTLVAGVSDGLNTIASKLALNSGAEFLLQPYGMLAIAETIDSRGYDLVFGGGGTFELSKKIGGTNSSGTDWGAHIQNARVVVDSTSLMAGWSTGKVFLEDENAALELATTVADAESQILGGDIVDVLGRGLTVTDIGGGRTEVLAGYEPPLAGAWQLEFEDNFDGNSLNGNQWRLGTATGGLVGKAEIHPHAVTVADGLLHITSREEPIVIDGVTSDYTAAQISTFKTFRQKYGYFEARIKYPAVTGLWPAFWLMPDRGLYGQQNLYHESYLKFDLSGINLSSVQSAELRVKPLYVEDTSNGSNNLVFMKLEDDSWDASTLTWEDRLTPDPLWLARYVNGAVVGQDMVADVTDFVVQEMAGDQVLSFVLADTFMRTRQIGFHSSEAANADDRPRLVIDGVTYFPSEDTYVRAGAYASMNFSSEPELIVEEGWANTSTTYDGGMEVDIFESLGIWGENVTSHALHWDGYGVDHQNWGPGEHIYYPATRDDFHTYGVYWEEGLIEFFVDGVKTAEFADERVMSVEAYMILSLQVGGWDGNTAGPQVDGQTIEVDWVRAWSGTKE